MGTNCQIEKNGYTSLSTAYRKITFKKENTYNSILASISNTLTPSQIQSVDNLIRGASQFYQDTSFVNQAYVFLTMVLFL